MGLGFRVSGLELRVVGFREPRLGPTMLGS